MGWRKGNEGGVSLRGPAAARLELRVGLVKGRVAARAVVDSLRKWANRTEGSEESASVGGRWRRAWSQEAWARGGGE